MMSGSDHRTPTRTSDGSSIPDELANAEQLLRSNHDGSASEFGDDSWLNQFDAGRVASVLRMLDATLCLDSTHATTDSDQSILSPIVPPRVGRFEIGELLGEGSFGAVYRAFDTVLLRDVAIKAVALHPRLQTTNEDYRLNEARAAAKLNHPNLVPLFEVVSDDQCVYLVSEFCDGPTLAMYLQNLESPMCSSWAAEIALKLCDAMAHAHGRGLAHRDIKPSNVLLSPERAADDMLPFSPRLTDFGLVLEIDQQANPKKNFRLAGTILYMAPEQMRGDPHIDACQGDVYAMGLMLYRMLAGRLPYRSSTKKELFREICVTPIQRIEESEPAIPNDLHAIYLKALRKNPDERYASFQEFADDLIRFRDGREVLARPRSRRERIWRVTRGEPVISGLAVALISLIVTGFVIFGLNNRRLRLQGVALSEALDAASTSEQKAIQVAASIRHPAIFCIVVER